MPDRTNRKTWIAGGGIAGLSAATYLIREGGFEGASITILSDDPLPGGALDGSGSSEAGYLIRGGRMFEAHFGCTWDLLALLRLNFSSKETLAGVRIDEWFAPPFFDTVFWMLWRSSTQASGSPNGRPSSPATSFSSLWDRSWKVRASATCGARPGSKGSIPAGPGTRIDAGVSRRARHPRPHRRTVGAQALVGGRRL